jgi:hypothetical protein
LPALIYPRFYVTTLVGVKTFHKEKMCGNYRTLQ